MTVNSVAQAGTSPVRRRSPEEFRDLVPGYYINAINDFISRCGPFAGKRVLEIGGSSLPRELVLDVLGAEQWVCVDMLDHASGRYQREAQSAHYSGIGVETLVEGASFPNRYMIFDGSAERIPASFDAQFDVVFSINSFEHILPLEAVLRRAHCALRDAGLLFSQFGPIWSCAVGSHFWVNDSFNFNQPDPLPPWAHLLMDREHVQAHLRAAGLAEDSVKQALYQIFESTFVNRRFYEGYAAAMADSAFAEFTIEPLWSQKVPAETQARLALRHPGHTEFGAYGIRIVGRRQVSATMRNAGTARSVLVCGSGRSGTSALAGMFDPQVYFQGDNLFPPTPSNPKGYFENYAINDVNEMILVRSAVAHLGAETAGKLLAGHARGQLWLARWPTSMPVCTDDSVRRAIRRIVLRRPFCLKDPRFAVTAPVWLAELPDTVVLCIYRPPAVTVESILHECRTASYLRSHRISVSDAFALWRQTHRRLLQLYRDRPDVLFVRYADLFEASRMDALEQLLGTQLSHDFAERALDRTASDLRADEHSEALFSLLEAIAKADFGSAREAALPLIDAFEARYPAADTVLPEDWQFEPRS